MITDMRGHARPELAPPSACPKFESCSAPICPLDPDMLEREHLEGETTCLYLREYAKEGGEGRFSANVPEVIAEAVPWAYPLVLARYVPLKKQLERAVRAPSKRAGFTQGEGA